MVDAKLQDLEGRLIKLENRSKENFFEIEKKFTTFESKPAEGLPEKVEERMHELEDLLLLLQVEYTKIKEAPPAPKAVAAPSVPVISTDMEQRLARLESDVKAKPIPAMPIIGPDLENRLVGIEEKMKSGVSIPPDIMNSMKTVDMQSRKILSIEESMNKIKDAMQSSGKISKKEIQDYIDRFNTAKRELSSEYERLKALKGEFDRVMVERDTLVSKIGDAEVNVEKADALISRMKVIEEKISADAERIEDMKNEVDSKVKNNIREVDFIRKDMESRIQTLEGKFKSRFEKLDSVKDSLDTKLLSLEERVEEYDKFSKNTADVSSLKKSVDMEISRRTSIENNLEALHEKVSSIEGDVSKMMQMRQTLGREATKETLLEKSVKELSGRMDTVEKTGVSYGFQRQPSKELLQRLEEETTQRMSLEKAMQDLSNKMMLFENAVQEVNSIKSALDEESAERVSLEKAMQDIRARSEQPYRTIEDKIEKELSAKTRELHSKIDELRLKIEMESKEFSKTLDLSEMKKIREEILAQRKTVQNLEGKLDSAAKRFFAENLEDFARALDKRLPNMVTREEFERSLKEIKQKTPYSPDQSAIPLSARVNYLDRRINEIHDMMKDFSNRIPVIVE
ncbi:MAG: hypothetical protein V1900_01850 [Candidatus Aenigmatarchaeota archaeon]